MTLWLPYWKSHIEFQRNLQQIVVQIKESYYGFV